MPNQHRPGREIPKVRSPGVDPVLERFYNSLRAGNVDKAARLLEQLDKKPPIGMWMHRALGMVFEAPAQTQVPLLDLLLKSAHPPQPTANSDFIKLAVNQQDLEPMFRLLEAGFRPLAGKDTANRLVERMDYRGDVDPNRIKPAYLEGLTTHCLVRACATAVVKNRPEAWLRTLNQVLPNPRPTQDITRQVMNEMMNLGEQMDTVSRTSLNLARDLWWVDFNMAEKLHQDKSFARNYKGQPMHKEESLALHAQALSMIERSNIEEELVDVAAPAARPPRKRL